MKKSFQIALSLIVLLSFNSCIQEEATSENDNFNFSQFKISPFKAKRGNKNYVVTNNTTIDIVNDKINIEVPVPLNDYKFLNVYNVSSNNQAAILYLVGRNETNKVADLPINYVIQDELSISNIGLDTKLMKNENGLRIFVMNNSQELDVNSNLVNCIEDQVYENSSNVCTVTRSPDGPKWYKDGIIML